MVLRSGSLDWRTVVQLALVVYYLFVPQILPVLQRRKIKIFQPSSLRRRLITFFGTRLRAFPFRQEISPQFGVLTPNVAVPSSKPERTVNDPIHTDVDHTDRRQKQRSEPERAEGDQLCSHTNLLCMIDSAS